MGLFQHRPEDPTEWAGLPSEPWESESDAEKLSEAAPPGFDLTGLLDPGESVSISIEQVEDEAS